MFVQAWAEDMAAFVKGLAPNHLIMLGTIGMFGASTPALTKLNPFDLVNRRSTGAPAVVRRRQSYRTKVAVLPEQAVVGQQACCIMLIACRHRKHTYRDRETFLCS